jgi:hypothetical protein
MPMRDNIRTDKLRTRGFKQPAETPGRVRLELLSGNAFEVVSWLTATGVLIAAVLAAAYPAFEPAAALLGQFP